MWETGGDDEDLLGEEDGGEGGLGYFFHNNDDYDPSSPNNKPLLPSSPQPPFSIEVSPWGGDGSPDTPPPSPLITTQSKEEEEDEEESKTNHKMMTPSPFKPPIAEWRKEFDQGIDWEESSIRDGKLDVVGVMGTLHLGQTQVGLAAPIKICQCSEIDIHIKRSIPMQADGEPWGEKPCHLNIRAMDNQGIMLKRMDDTRHGFLFSCFYFFILHYFFFQSSSR